MASTFNPYAEWLQLDAHITRPNYYELLGVKQTESDNRLIAAAAERAASRVRSHRPGPHAAVWADLLDEIAAAKKCLLSRSTREQYDRTLGTQTRPATKSAPADLYPPGSMPGSAGRSEAPNNQPTRKAAQASGPVKPGKAPSAVENPTQKAAAIPAEILPPTNDPQSPYVPPQAGAAPGNSPNPMAPGTPASATDSYSHPVDEADETKNPMAPMRASDSLPQSTASPLAQHPAMQAVPLHESIDPLPSMPIVAAQRTASPDDRSPMATWIMPVILGAVAGLALLAVLFVARKVMNRQPLQVAQQQQVAAENTAPLQSPADPGKSTGIEEAIDKTLPTPREIPQQVLSPLADPKKVVPMPEEKDGAQKPTSKSKPPATTTNVERTASTEKRTEPASQPKSTSGTENVQPSAETKPSANPVSNASVTETPKSPISKAELTKLGRAMQKARDAIADHEFDLAAEFLAIAWKMPRSPEHDAKLERLQILLDAVKRYRAAINTSISKLEVGTTFEINNNVVGVVEVSRDKIALRVSGRNVTYAIPELPPGLAAELAEQTLAEKDPETIMMKAAFTIASRRANQGDLAKARSFLEEAAATNEDAKALVPILEDSYDLAK